jgi:hypothetical protein
MGAITDLMGVSGWAGKMRPPAGKMRPPDAFPEDVDMCIQLERETGDRFVDDWALPSKFRDGSDLEAFIIEVENAADAPWRLLFCVRMAQSIMVEADRRLGKDFALEGFFCDFDRRISEVGLWLRGCMA